jgi:hypothetical protein
MTGIIDHVESKITRNMGGGTGISFTFGKPLAEMTTI